MTVLGIATLLQVACMKPNKTERIAQIDAQLANWVPTGRADDADTRSALRAERARLMGASPRQPTVTTTTAFLPSSGTTQIVVAHDSQSSTNEDWANATKRMDAQHGRINGASHPNGDRYDNLGHLIGGPSYYRDRRRP